MTRQRCLADLPIEPLRHRQMEAMARRGRRRSVRACERGAGAACSGTGKPVFLYLVSARSNESLDHMIHRGRIEHRLSATTTCRTSMPVTRSTVRIWHCSGALGAVYWTILCGTGESRTADLQAAFRRPHITRRTSSEAGRNISLILGCDHSRRSRPQEANSILERRFAATDDARRAGVDALTPMFFTARSSQGIDGYLICAFPYGARRGRSARLLQDSRTAGRGGMDEVSLRRDVPTRSVSRPFETMAADLAVDAVRASGSTSSRAVSALIRPNICALFDVAATLRDVTDVASVQSLARDELPFCLRARRRQIARGSTDPQPLPCSALPGRVGDCQPPSTRRMSAGSRIRDLKPAT